MQPERAQIHVKVILIGTPHLYGLRDGVEE